MKNAKHFHIAAAAFAVALFATDLAGQTAPDSTADADSLPRYELAPVTVTARRIATERHDLTQRVDVVTIAEMDRVAPGDIVEGLKETLGLDVIQYPGLLSGVSIRGFRPQFSGTRTRTLILIDGHPAGVSNLATLDPAAFSRVEVLRGPAAALYGSSAMGGAVNFVTRESTGPLSGAANAWVGSFGSYSGSARLGGAISPRLDLDLAFSASGRRSGYDVGESRFFGADSVTKFLDSGGTSSMPELQLDSTVAFAEYGVLSGSARLGWDVADAWRLTVGASAFEANDVQSPGDLIAGYGRTLNDLSRRAADVSLTGTVGPHLATIRGFTSHEVTAYYDDPDSPSFTSYTLPITTAGIQLQDFVEIGRVRILGGFDATLDRSESERLEAPDVKAPPYAPDSEIRSTALFGEAAFDGFGERVTATLGGRIDRVGYSVAGGRIWDFESWSAISVPENTEVRTVINPSAGLLVRLGDGWAARGNVGRAFVNPDPFHVAGYAERRVDDRAAVRITQGNPSLDPENSLTWDVGLAFGRGSSELEVTYFDTDVRDRVVATAVALDGPRTTQAGDTIIGIVTYANADHSEIQGIEARASHALPLGAGSVRIFANGTRILRAREISGGAPRAIRNVAELTVTGGAEYTRAGSIARLSGRYVGERRDDDFVDWMNPGEIAYPRFLVVDASAAIPIRERVRVQLAVDNVLDENYYEVRGYNLPGRAFRIGASMDF